MTDQTNTPAAAAEAPSYLGMTDAEMMAAPVPEATPLVPEAVVAADQVVPEKEEKDPVAVGTEGADLAANGEPADQAGDDDAADLDDEAKRDAKQNKEAKAPADADDADDAGGDKEKKPVETSAVDFEAEYKRLLTPFKANGHEIAVNSVDDAIQLMQMGANYNKKMAGLKPNLKLMKMLENSGFLSEDKIGYLIDLGNKNPDAINKLVKESGINPMDLDAEKAGDYKPKIHSVDDREMELDTVLDEISTTPSYNQTLDIVSTKWDGASKQVLANSPQLLKVINDHVSSGIYDLIAKEVANERMFDRLKGLSDIEVYRHVGDAIQARGGFNHLGSSQGKPATKTPVVVVPKPKLVDESLNDKKRAASSTKPAAASTVAKDFNPLSLSDADFSKLVVDKYV